MVRYVKIADDIGGTLGAPFGLFPPSLVKGSVEVEASGDPRNLVFAEESVPEEGVEPPT